MGNRLVIIQAAGLGYEFLHQHDGLALAGLEFQRLAPLFPALTCTAQASFRTAMPPSGHGMVANGLFHRELRRPLLWEQSSALVQGERIWAAFRKRGKRVAVLFWQQSLGEEADQILSPAPIHKHGGGMVQSVYSKPAPLYDSLCAKLGGRFQLHRYWGPLASASSSDWIARATAALLADRAAAPDLCLTYLPALDYDLQRYGPSHPASRRALHALGRQIALIHRAALENGYDLIVYGDYAIGPVSEAILPNVALREAGLFSTRTVNGRLYPDFHASAAFALVDHEVAHIILNPAACRGGAVLESARRLLSALPGVARVLAEADQRVAGIAHPHSGELVLVARPGCWFAYPWWQARHEAPDYASHVDIHSKPGYDPCELFFGWPPISVSQDTSRIRGSHGHTGAGTDCAWASTCTLAPHPASLLDLAVAVRSHLETLP